MSKHLKSFFAVITLGAVGITALLAIAGAQRDVEPAAINFLTGLAVFMFLAYMFFVAKLIQKTPRKWVRLINKFLFISTGFLAVLALLVIGTDTSSFQTTELLYYLLITGWAMTAAVALLKTLQLEQNSFKEKTPTELLKSADKKVMEAGNNLIEKHIILASVLAAGFISALLYIAYLG